MVNKTTKMHLAAIYFMKIILKIGYNFAVKGQIRPPKSNKLFIPKKTKKSYNSKAVF